MNNSAAVIINASSGVSETEQAIELLRKSFAQLSFDVEFFLVHPGIDVTEVTQKAIAQGYKIIVAGGGDGTINAVSSQLIGSDIALGILPAGTFNHLARDLNIPIDLKEAVKIIAGQKNTSIDVGMVNDKIFVNNSSIGLYSKLVQYREEEQKSGWSKRWAVIKALYTSIGKYSFLNVELEIDGAIKLLKTPLVFVGNNCYEIEGLDLGTRKNIDSRELCVYAVKHSGKINLVTMILWAVFGKLRGHENFDEFRAQSLTLKTRKRFLRVALDGEVVTLESPLHYSIHPKALKVIIP